jgi:hypothetical protein
MREDNLMIAVIDTPHIVIDLEFLVMGETMPSGRVKLTFLLPPDEGAAVFAWIDARSKNRPDADQNGDSKDGHTGM